MYRYFAKPHEFSTYTAEAKQCHFCGRTQAGYNGPFFVADIDIQFVCEKCLRAGALQTVGATTNEGDLVEIRGDIALRYHDRSETERAELLRERRAELECRTPHILTWQDFFWPVHCADYMRFEQEVGHKDIMRSCGPEGPVEYLRRHMEPGTRSNTDFDDLWESMYPEHVERTPGWDIGVYKFVCIECGDVMLRWDAS